MEKEVVARGGFSVSTVASEAITGPGILKGFGSGTSSLLEKKFLLENWWNSRVSRLRTISGMLGDVFLAAWARFEGSLAL